MCVRFRGPLEEVELALSELDGSIKEKRVRLCGSRTSRQCYTGNGRKAKKEIVAKFKIVIASGTLANYPQGGGVWSAFLQYALGLADLRHDVYWLELYEDSGDPARDRALIDGFLTRFRRLGFDGKTCVLTQPRLTGDITALPELAHGRIHGMTLPRVREMVRSADMLWNLSCTVRQPLLSLFRHRVLIDGDPGSLQVWALTYGLDVLEHQTFLTAGLNVHNSECEVPTLGVKWHRFPQFVYLPMWQAAPDPGPEAPFSSLAHWNWGELWLNGRILSTSKREAYMRYAELPARTRRSFELAADIRPGHESGDRELLEANRWRIVDPWEVASTPEAYRQYIARSRAEFACPKPIYRELRTGWFSDRSACYLAQGRPVLAEDTGFGEHLPVGKGLLVFRNTDEARAAVDEIDRNYKEHSRAARRLAEQHLDSRRCLQMMLAACQ